MKAKLISLIKWTTIQEPKDLLSEHSYIVYIYLQYKSCERSTSHMVITAKRTCACVTASFSPFMPSWLSVLDNLTKWKLSENFQYFKSWLSILDNLTKRKLSDNFQYLWFFISMDIMLRAFWRSGNFKNTRRWIRGRVLLTGATGFLGVFLLRDLIRFTKVKWTDSYKLLWSCAITNLWFRDFLTLVFEQSLCVRCWQQKGASKGVVRGVLGWPWPPSPHASLF